MSNDHQAYLAKRQLKRGTAGWILLAGLGVSYVISGDFAGWNFGIAQAGWAGAVCLGWRVRARGGAWGGGGRTLRGPARHEPPGPAKGMLRWA